MSGFKLYEISEELMTLEDMLYDDTVDQETVQDTLEMINMDFEDKADNYAKIIRTMDNKYGSSDVLRVYARS